MTRYVLVLVGALAMLLAAGALEGTRQSRRDRAARVRPLIPAWNTDMLDRFALKSGPAWRYVRRDDAWHCVDYHDVGLDRRQADRFLAALLASTANIRAVTPAPSVSADGSTALAVTLGAGTDSVVVFIGDRVAGPVPERIARLAGSDTIYQLHADPIALISSDAPDRPPLLDRRVLADGRQAYERILVEGPDRFLLTRQATVPDPREPFKAPAVSWHIEERDRSGPLGAAPGYVDYVTNLAWSRVVASPSRGPDGRLILWAESRSDTLHVWLGDVQHILRNGATGRFVAIPMDTTYSLLPARDEL